MFKNTDVALLFFASLVFACSLTPIVDKLSQKMSRTKASIIVLSSFILILLILIVPILLISAYEIKNFTSDFPKYIDQLDETIASYPILNHIHLKPLNMSIIMNNLAIKSSDIITHITDLIENIGSIFLYLFTFVIFIFFMLVDKDVIKKTYLKFYPSEIRKKAERISDCIFDKLGGYVFAQTVISGSVWLFMTIGLILFKIKYAFILGIICGILSIIPVVGSALSLIISLIATYQCGFLTLVIVTVLYCLSHIFENNVVRPYIYSKFMNIHPIIIFMSLFIGAKYAGVTGVLFAPPIATVICILIEELYLKKMD
jgi:predicted PurR-regulated permease PerM